MSMFDCVKCYPRLCSCPGSYEDQIASLEMAVESNFWSENEMYGMKKEIEELKCVIRNQHENK